MSDLLARAASLVGISSLSFQEEDLANLVEAILRAQPHLEVERVGDNVIARTNLGRDTRVLLAGHLDTVNSSAGLGRTEGEVLYGLGAADMKGTLAVMRVSLLSRATTSPGCSTRGKKSPAPSQASVRFKRRHPPSFRPMWRFLESPPPAR